MPDRYIAEELLLEEVSHVDSPANKGAVVVLWKRATQPNKPGDQTMTTKTLEDMIKVEAILQTANTTLTDSLTKSIALVAARDASVSVLKAALLSAGFDVTFKDDVAAVTKADDSLFVDVGGERVLKSSIPAGVLKSLEASAAAIAVLTKNASDETMRKRAEQIVKNIPGTADVRIDLMRAVDSIADVAKRDAVVTALEATCKSLSRLTTEIGNSSSDEGSPIAQLNKMASDHAAANKTTFEVAFTEVIKTTTGSALAAQARAATN